MTAETTGSSVWISRYKDIEIADILGKNGNDSFMVCSEDDYTRAVEALADAETVWIHDVQASNADNRVCFRIAKSTAWRIARGKLVDEQAWPRPDCQDICRPCQRD